MEERQSFAPKMSGDECHDVFISLGKITMKTIKTTAVKMDSGAVHYTSGQCPAEGVDGVCYTLPKNIDQDPIPCMSYKVVFDKFGVKIERCYYKDVPEKCND